MRVNSRKQYAIRLISQFCDSLRTPRTKPNTVARAMPQTATSMVLRMPTAAARMWVDLELYSMKGEKVMS